MTDTDNPDGSAPPAAAPGAYHMTDTALAQALTRHLGHDVGAEIAVAAHGGRTPANHRAALAAARLAAAEQAISSDDALHALMEAFDGQIIPGSIRPNMADGDPEGHGADAERRP